MTKSPWSDSSPVFALMSILCDDIVWGGITLGIKALREREGSLYQWLMIVYVDDNAKCAQRIKGI